MRPATSETGLTVGHSTDGTDYSPPVTIAWLGGVQIWAVLMSNLWRAAAVATAVAKSIN